MKYYYIFICPGDFNDYKTYNFFLMLKPKNKEKSKIVGFSHPQPRL